MKISSSKKRFRGTNPFENLNEEELNPKLLPYVKNIHDNELWVRHFLCWHNMHVTLEEKSISNTIANSTFKQNRKLYRKAIKEKYYEDVLCIIPNGFLLKWFLYNYKRIYKYCGDERYFKLLAEVLTTPQFGHYQYRKHYSKFISYGKNPLNMMSDLDRKVYDRLPEKFSVYCGTSSNYMITAKNIKGVLKNSWSLDKEIAVWFSMGNSNSKHLIILSYEVNKSEVISYFENPTTLGSQKTKEREIFLDYTKIDLNRVTYEYCPDRKNFDFDFLKD